MTKPTGRPNGRPKGSTTRAAVKRSRAIARVARAIEAGVPDAFAGDAHAYLMTVYKDPSVPRPERIDAAGKAIKFEKPALAAVDLTSMGESIKPDVSDKPIDRDGETWIEAHARPH